MKREMGSVGRVVHGDPDKKHIGMASPWSVYLASSGLGCQGTSDEALLNEKKTV